MRHQNLSSAVLLSATAFFAGCDDDGKSIVGADLGGQLKVAAATVTTRANDLRGLTYASGGKIYVSGHSGTGTSPATTTTATTRKLVVGRFNADGSPDLSFDTDGFIEVDVAPNKSEESLGIVELAGGDILVAVNAADNNGGAPITAGNDSTVQQARPDGQNVYLLRFSNTGAPVTSFGSNGRAEVVFGWAETENNAWPTPTLTAGSPNTFSHSGFPTDAAWDLQLDTTAGVERVVLFGMGSARRGELSGTVQRTDVDRYVARILTASGAPDPSFNGGKAFTWNSGGALGDNGRRGFVESGGKILSAGYTNLGAGNGSHVVLIRLTSSGVLDPSFTGISSTPAVVPVQNGVAVFNPFKVDGGVSENYAVVQQSSGAYVTTGYGAATASGSASTLGFRSSLAQDVVSFRVANGTVDASWGNGGAQAFQSEGLFQPTNEDRGRDLVRLPDDRLIEVGYFGGIPAAYVVTQNGRLDTRVNGDGIIQFPHPTITSQFFNVASSADGRRVAMTTNDHVAGARLVILELIN